MLNFSLSLPELHSVDSLFYPESNVLNIINKGFFLVYIIELKPILRIY